ncbi:unnamed protein product [Trichobilharzia regenti]|nr:unnamed protein product [Trichobilharzia regenti]
MHLNSESHVELMPITGGLTKEPSPNRVSFTTSDYDSSFSSNTMNGCSDNLSSLIHLEAICLVVETPQATKILSTKQLGTCQLEDTKNQNKENGFSGQLENNCLLEEADLRRQFPNSSVECFWRKATVDVNCKLPSRTNGIKLSIGVIPTVDMLFTGTSSDEPNPCSQSNRMAQVEFTLCKDYIYVPIEISFHMPNNKILCDTMALIV